MLLGLKEKKEKILQLGQSTSLIGLDIGSTSVKMVRFETKQGKPIAVEAMYVEHDSADSDSTENQETIPQSIHRCIKACGKAKNNLVCALAGPEVILQPFSFPALPKEAMGQAIRMEAQQVCPFDMTHSALSWQIVPSARENSDEQTNLQEGFYVVATPKALKQKIQWVEKAGGKVMLMDVEGLAAMNCLCHCLDLSSSDTVSLIHIGNRLTSVIILGQDGMPFIRSLCYAGKNILTNIQQQAELTEEEIHRVLFNSDQDETALSDIQPALKNASMRSIADINETLRYFLSQHPGSNLSNIYLSGGWALSRPYVELLIDALPASVEVFNPFHTIPIQAPPAQEALMKLSGPALTVASGLAMRTIS